MLATDIASVLSAARDSRDTARAQAQLSLAQVEAGEDGVDAADAAIAAAQRAFDAYARLERARSAEARHAKSAWLEARRWADAAEKATTALVEDEPADYADRRDDARCERYEADRDR